VAKTFVAARRPATGDEIDELKDAVRKGVAFERRGGPRPTFDAALVRRLVLRGEARRGVELRGVAIEGLLDLRDARGAAGQSCNALILEDCELLGENADAATGEPGIDARHGHLARLALVDCRTDGVELSGAVIDGDLALDGLGPIEDRGDAGACWVRARGVQVGSGFTAGRARLSLPWPAGSAWPPAGAPRWRDVTAPYALDLVDARIAGSVHLQPAFSSRGGIRLAGAAVHGSLGVAGARVTAAGIRRSTESIYAQYAQVDGAVFLCNDALSAVAEGGDGRFRARGTLGFYGARIGGALVLSGAEVTLDDVREWGLVLSSASVSDGLHLDESGDGTQCEIPSIDLQDAEVGGLRITAGLRTPVELLTGTNLTVRGDLTLVGWMSQVDLAGSSVEGQAVLGSEHNPFRLTSVNGGHAQLGLADAHVGRDLSVAQVATGTRVTIDWDRKPVRVQAVELACYPGWLLGEALLAPSSASGPGDGVALLAFLARPPDPEQRDDPRVVVLNGSASPIFDLDRHLELGTADQAREYLLLFCSHVWGDEGPFMIAPDTVEIGPGPSAGSWTATAEITYGAAVYRAEFLLQATGEVEMVDDEPLRRSEGRHLFAAPVRWFPAPPADWPAPWTPVGPADRWFELLPEGPGADVWAALVREQRLLAQPTGVWPRGDRRPQADLRGLKVSSLNDGDGLSWFGLEELPKDVEQPVLQLLLSGFSYDRISDREAAARESATGPLPFPEQRRARRPTAAAEASAFRRLLSRVRRAAAATGRAMRGSGAAARRLLASLRHPGSLVRTESNARDRVDARLYWLASQYADDPPTDDDYRPEPYQQLARTLRSAGYLSAADDVTFEMLRLEKVRLARPRLAPLGAAWHRTLQGATRVFVEIPFGFGLKPRRAIATFFVFWGIGVAAIWALDDALKVEASAVATVVSSEGETQRVVVQAAADTDAPEEVDCGDHINELIYPLDAMIPLIDLRQETRCHFSITNWGLGVAQGLYTIIGWVVISGLIVTLSGVVRRHIER
jgi:hypothetical protein